MKNHQFKFLLLLLVSLSYSYVQSQSYNISRFDYGSSHEPLFFKEIDGKLISISKKRVNGKLYFEQYDYKTNECVRSILVEKIGLGKERSMLTDGIDRNNAKGFGVMVQENDKSTKKTKVILLTVNADGDILFEDEVLTVPSKGNTGNKSKLYYTPKAEPGQLHGVFEDFPTLTYFDGEKPVIAILSDDSRRVLTTIDSERLKTKSIEDFMYRYTFKKVNQELKQELGLDKEKDDPLKDKVFTDAILKLQSKDSAANCSFSDGKNLYFAMLNNNKKVSIYLFNNESNELELKNEIDLNDSRFTSDLNLKFEYPTVYVDYDGKNFLLRLEGFIPYEEWVPDEYIVKNSLVKNVNKVKLFHHQVYLNEAFEINKIITKPTRQVFGVGKLKYPELKLNRIRSFNSDSITFTLLANPEAKGNIDINTKIGTDTQKKYVELAKPEFEKNEEGKYYCLVTNSQGEVEPVYVATFFPTYLSNEWEQNRSTNYYYEYGVSITKINRKKFIIDLKKGTNALNHEIVVFEITD